MAANYENDRCPICGSGALGERQGGLRDSDDHKVLECETCTHVFLDRFSHIDDTFYEQGGILQNRPFGSDIAERVRHFEAENDERLRRVGNLLTNKRVLDFGCGAGGFMQKAAGATAAIVGVEPSSDFRRVVEEQGFTVYRELGDVTDRYDLVISFHVLEHLRDPVAALVELKRVVEPGGVIYLEVPNVNDALQALYDVEAYRRFHFFKAHLHYFSRQSLAEAIRRAKLGRARIIGHCRFSLANHLYWIRHNKPGGHNAWAFLESPQLVELYNAALAAADMADSLVAHIDVPDQV